MTISRKLVALLEDFDSSAKTPKIASVGAAVARPRWSVMIPTFNCAEYLPQALASVLAQDPGAEHMQIEVVDDCSTKDNPEAVVKDVGGGRVSFYRKDKNEGAVDNFNTCIQRSVGKMVHILHGDDYVSRDFYSTIDSLESQFPGHCLYATRSFIVNEHSTISRVSDRLAELEAGGRCYGAFISSNPLHFAGVTIKRSFFEQYGGFHQSLVHCADWEMWVRAVANGGGVVSPQVLSSYRMFEGNDTSRLIMTAENLKDQLRMYSVFDANLPSFQIGSALRALVSASYSQAGNLRTAGRIDAAEHAKVFAKRLDGVMPIAKRSLARMLYGISMKLRSAGDRIWHTIE